MGLLVVFIVCLAIGQTFTIILGLAVERYTSPYTGLITFIAGYFMMFWFSWTLAVWLTVPGKRLGHFLTGKLRSNGPGE
jgi:hypothetical protein